MQHEIVYYKLYELVLDDKKLDAKNLKSVGFNVLQIAELIARGVIKKTGFMTYALSDYSHLFSYGKHLYEILLYDKSEKAMDLYFSKYPNDIESYYNFILMAIKHGNYDKVKNTCNKILLLNDLENRHNALVLLSILKYLVNLDNRTNSLLNVFKDEELTNPNISEYELNIIKGKISTGYNIFISSEKEDNIYSQVINELFLEVLKEKRNIDNNINLLIRRRDFDSAREYFKEKSMAHSLTNKHMAMFHILTALNDIKDSRIIPKPKLGEDTNLYAEILNNNFKRALEMIQELCVIQGEDVNENTLVIVLREVLEVINEIEKSKNISKWDYLRQMHSSSNTEFHEIAKSIEDNSLSYEDSLLYKLVCAKYYYENDEYIKYSKLMKEVFNAPNKTSRVWKRLKALDNLNKKQENNMPIAK